MDNDAAPSQQRPFVRCAGAAGIELVVIDDDILLQA
jgi:hypothetical protein